MNTSKIEIDRIFLCSIDSAKAFVEYNEYTIDPDGEIFQYILQLFARNYDNTDAKKCFFKLDSFIASILPEDATVQVLHLVNLNPAVASGCICLISCLLISLPPQKRKI